MGNRGCLHDADGQIIKLSARKAWVTWLLEFKQRHRQVMTPGKYTELFFLDEATALAAGHRPCGACQPARYRDFKLLWLQVNRGKLKEGTGVVEGIDSVLHAQRVGAGGRKVVWRSPLSELPEGSLVALTDLPGQAWLLWGRALWRWSASGHTERRESGAVGVVDVLMPRSVVAVVGAGYLPMVHTSAGQPKRTDHS